jgi:hypothetical protein
MEPIDRHVGLLEGLADGRQEGRRHVADDFNDAVIVAAM